MARFTISLQDRQTGKTSTVIIEVKSYTEAKAIAMKDYGVAYIVK